MITIAGNPQMTLHFNLDQSAGEKGNAGRCPYTTGTEKELVWAWEQGHKQALEVAS